MQATSELYKSIWQDDACIVQAKVTIAGKDYVDGLFGAQGDIASLSTPASLFAGSGPSVGGTICREIDLDLRTNGAGIPRMAEMRVFVRLVLADEVTETILQASEWIPKGVFYIATRKLDTAENILTIHGYDRMIFAEDVYLQEGDTGDWPRLMSDVVADISDRLGVSIDSRTTINAAYTMDYPNDYTMRELLGYVAAAHAGNWIMTDAGELRLVPLYNPATEYSGLGYLGTENGEAISFGGVLILV